MENYAEILRKRLIEVGLKEESPGIALDALKPIYKTVSDILDRHDPMFARDIAYMLVIAIGPSYYVDNLVNTLSRLSVLGGGHGIRTSSLENAVRHIYGSDIEIDTKESEVRRNSTILYKSRDKLDSYIKKYTHIKKIIKCKPFPKIS